MKYDFGYLLLALSFLISIFNSGCEKTFEPISPEIDLIVEGVNFTKLFAEPSSDEISAIFEEWDSRDVSAQSIEEVVASSVPFGSTQTTVRIVSHKVNEVRHFGAIVVPKDRQMGSLPILIYLHGGDKGENIDATLTYLPLAFGSIQDSFVYVVPSFRSERLVFGGAEYLSEGEPSPWDYDVDDALAFLNVALATTPEANPERIGVIGFSRGACVGMLMAVRDSRIDLTIEFYGPTDFFGSFAQEVIEEALQGKPRDLPCLDYLNNKFLQPLKSGDIPIKDIRVELLRRSPVYFAQRLPKLQVHHGTADKIVYVSQAKRLIEVMQELDRSEVDFEFYLYEGGRHDPLTLYGCIDHTQDFLALLLAPEFAQ